MTSETIEVTLPRMRYDILQPLLDGRVEIAGISLKQGRSPGGGMLTSDSPYKAHEASRRPAQV